MKISIIIPVLNEAAIILKLLQYLIHKADSSTNIKEIIVVDGGSRDDSKILIDSFAKSQAVNIRFLTSSKGRARQLNCGAKESIGEILYFLHADTFPPIAYDSLIINEVKNGNFAGCFRMKFDDNHWWLKLLGWMTRFKSKKCRGGDQSQFITKSLFEQIDGYDESYIVYEDNDLVDRLFAINQFVIIPQNIITSARRYREIGIWRLQYHFLNIHIKKWMGASSEELYQYYKNRVAN